MNFNDSEFSVYSHWAKPTLSGSFSVLLLTRTQDSMCFKCNPLRADSAYGSPWSDKSAAMKICVG